MTRLGLLLHHNSIPPMLCTIVAGIVIVAWQGPAWIWLLAILGVPAQMTNEYLIHRFLFHLHPPGKQWAFDLLYQAHYGHHDFPTNQKLIFAPIWIVLPVLCINFVAVYGILLLLAPAYALAAASAIVLIGGTATFVGYEWFHMTAHTNVSKTRVERYVSQLHNQHHFRDFSKWFHVSPGGEFIDRAMGTAIDRDALRDQQRIEFIRTLGMRPDDHRLIAARNRFAGKYGLTEKEISHAARV